MPNPSVETSVSSIQIVDYNLLHWVYQPDAVVTLTEAEEEVAKVGALVEAHLGLVTGSTISRVIGNFYMQVFGPKHPERLFSSEDEARKWLDSFAA